MKNSSRFDVAVVGAGVGGGCAALALARRGFRVLLLEAHTLPRHKVCGEFLSPEIQNIFSRLGMLNTLNEAAPNCVRAARIVTSTRESGRLALPGTGLALSRYRLDKIFWDAIAATGAQVLDGTPVRAIEAAKDGGFEVVTSESRFLAKFVVAAPGRNTRIASVRDAASTGSCKQPQRYLGLKAHFRGATSLEDEVELHPFRGGYCGLVRVEGGITNACLLASYRSVDGRAPIEFWQWVLAQCPRLAARMKSAQQAIPWLSTANVSFGHSHPAHNGVLYCGDSAGYIQPFTGDGMAMAARSGELAAATVSAALRGSVQATDVAPLYSAAWRREFDARLRWAARLHPLLVASSVTSLTTHVLARAPRLAAFAVGATRGTTM